MISGVLSIHRKPVEKSTRFRKNKKCKTTLTEAIRRLICALRTTSGPVAVFSFGGRISIMKASCMRFQAFVAEKHESLVGIYNQHFYISDVIDDFSLFFTDDEVSE